MLSLLSFSGRYFTNTQAASQFSTRTSRPVTLVLAGSAHAARQEKDQDRSNVTWLYSLVACSHRTFFTARLWDGAP